MESADQEEDECLVTRHVFIDTDIYRQLTHNIANPALRTWAKHIDDRKVVLHTTDITLHEVRRQLAEDVSARHRELSKIEKSFARWRHTASDLPATPSFDPKKVAKRLGDHFEQTLLSKWRAVHHRAMQVNAGMVFSDYFMRKPPFHKEGSKEFPDAFVVASLAEWASQNNESIYVLTGDKLLTRAAEDCHLGTLKSLEDLLRRASVPPGGEAEGIAEAILNAPDFDARFEAALDDLFPEIVFEYFGDLPDAEIADSKLEGVIQISNWSVVWRGSKRLTFIVTADVEVTLDVSFADRSLAMYDREDDRWFGATHGRAERLSNIEVEVLLEVNSRTGEFLSSELVNTEIQFFDEPDTFK
jgi:hypothetical protein